MLLALVPETNKAHHRLRTLSHLSALLLLLAVVLLLISGAGITHTEIINKLSFGLIDRRLADAVHRATTIPLVVFFLTHVLVNIKLVLSEGERRHGRWVNGSLVAVGLLLLGLTLYVEYWG